MRGGAFTSRHGANSLLGKDFNQLFHFFVIILLYSVKKYGIVNLPHHDLSKDQFLAV
jgi:hypothetical protein